MSGNVGIFADLILLALLLIGLVLGWRQGFVQALTRIIVVVAALLRAVYPDSQEKAALARSGWRRFQSARCAPAAPPAASRCRAIPRLHARSAWCRPAPQTRR